MNVNWSSVSKHLLAPGIVSSRAVSTACYSESFQVLLPLFTPSLFRRVDGRQSLCLPHLSVQVWLQWGHWPTCPKEYFWGGWRHYHACPCTLLFFCYSLHPQEQWALNSLPLGWFCWNLVLCLGAVKTQTHVVPASPRGSANPRGQERQPGDQ